MPETDSATATAPADRPASIQPIIENLPAVEEWLPASIVPFWELLSQIPIVGALIIAVVFFMLAFLVRFAIFRSLGRLAGLTESSVDDHILRDLRRPVFATILYPGLALAVGAAQLPFGSSVLVNLLVSVVVASWMRATLSVSGAMLSMLEKEDRFTLVERRTIPLFDLTIKLLTILIGSYVLLMIWGINPVGWLASAGIVGIAVGFAAKDTLANLFSGFFILADAPYQVGDFVVLESGERGEVTDVGLRSTRLLTRDDIEVTIPNAVIGNAKIINESGGRWEKERVRVKVGVAYGSDVDRVRQVLMEIAEGNPSIDEEPEPRVRFRRFGDNGLDFELMGWIHEPVLRGRVLDALNTEVYKRFAVEGIEIPYPKRDVYLHQVSPSEDD